MCSDPLSENPGSTPDLKDALHVCFVIAKSAGSEVFIMLPLILTEKFVNVHWTVLLAKLAPGDMIALKAKYHSICLASLYN